MRSTSLDLANLTKSKRRIQVKIGRMSEHEINPVFAASHLLSEVLESILLFLSPNIVFAKLSQNLPGLLSLRRTPKSYKISANSYVAMSNQYALTPP